MKRLTLLNYSVTLHVSHANGCKIFTKAPGFDRPSKSETFWNQGHLEWSSRVFKEIS